jgi:hypothetical protein
MACTGIALLFTREVECKDVDLIENFKTGPILDFCKYDDKPLGCIKARSFCQLFKEDPA